MPNWCFTNISLNCNNKRDANDVYQTIEHWLSYKGKHNDWGKNWLGNILINSGLYAADDIDRKEHPNCRGCVTYIECYEEQVIIQTETAWVPMLQMWKEVCDKIFPGKDIEIIYSAEEPGCGVFWSNDPVEILEDRIEYVPISETV